MVSAGFKRLVKFWLPAGILEMARRARRAAAPPEPPPEPDVGFLLPRRALGEIFPGLDAVDPRIPTARLGQADEWALPLAELLTLAALCKHLRPKNIFEIGTYRGASTLAIAMNTPPESKIFTLDLDPAARATHRHGSGVIGGFPAFTIGEAFLGTPFAGKIHQLFGDSNAFIAGGLAHQIDFVFIDADHSYDFVRKDTERAFELLAPGGVVLWDDYRWEPRHPECAGVTRCLNELSGSRRCYQVAGTRLAIYLDGRSAGDAGR